MDEYGRVRAAGFDVSVVVGYSAAYALFVHENLQAHHDVGQAKFLETPAREKQSQMAKIISKGMKAGMTPVQAMYAAGLYLQGESQKLCPVATGFLRNSANTRVESGELPAVQRG